MRIARQTKSCPLIRTRNALSVAIEQHVKLNLGSLTSQAHLMNKVKLVISIFWRQHGFQSLGHVLYSWHKEVPSSGLKPCHFVSSPSGPNHRSGVEGAIAHSRTLELNHPLLIGAQ